MQHANSRHEASSLLGGITGLGIVALVLLGISGTIYTVIAPDGLLASMFGRSLSAGTLALGSLFLIGLCAWFTGSSPRYRHQLSNLVVYGFAAAGLLYALRLWWTGVF